MADNIPEQNTPEVSQEFVDMERRIDVPESLKAGITELILDHLESSGRLVGMTPEDLSKFAGIAAAGGAIGVPKEVGIIDPDEESERVASGTMGKLLASYTEHNSELHPEAMENYTATVNPNVLVDKRTGALTLKGLERRLELNQTAPPQAVLYTDIKSFKAINDKIGETRGDQVINDVYGILQSSLRGGDLIARHHAEAGDEFIAVLCDDNTGRDRDAEDPSSPSEMIDAAKARIKEKMSEYLADEKNQDLLPWGFDISVGGVEWREGALLDELLKGAITEMRVHKAEQTARNGKYDRVTMEFKKPEDVAA